MKLLLDTHTFIWLESKPANLSAKAKTALQDTNNSLLLSVASVWEMQIKLQLSKLTLSLPLPQVIATQQEVNGIEILPVTLAHALALANLPLHHKDPFDRMLIAQAKVEGAEIVTHDSLFAQYDVPLVW